MDVLLSPHNDDETLFACYTLLVVQPLVLVCLRAPEAYGPPEMREAETAAAMDVVGCQWRQLEFSADEPDWDGMRDLVAPYLAVAGKVFAPFPEPLGHRQHNRVGELALELRPDAILYTTYTHREGRTIGPEIVDPPPGGEQVKHDALRCYRSQAADPRTAVHFQRPLTEYRAPAPARARPRRTAA